MRTVIGRRLFVGLSDWCLCVGVELLCARPDGYEYIVERAIWVGWGWPPIYYESTTGA